MTPGTQRRPSTQRCHVQPSLSPSQAPSRSVVSYQQRVGSRCPIRRHLLLISLQVLVNDWWARFFRWTAFSIEQQPSFKLPLAEATFRLETSTVTLDWPVSIAKRKRPFHKNLYEQLKTADGYPATEPVLTHRRDDGSFQLLYNTCPETDQLNDLGADATPTDAPSFYGCVGRLLSFSSEGVQVGGETTLDFRGLLPEARTVGYWTPVDKPVDGQNELEGAVFAVWAHKCSSPAATCECLQDGCVVTLESNGVRSGFARFSSRSSFATYKGDRICAGPQHVGRVPPGKFIYWLVSQSGWDCGRDDMHGAYLEFDEEHPEGIRTGTVFAVTRAQGKEGAFRVVATVFTGARIEPSFGLNALAAGPATIADNTDQGETRFRYVFSVRGRYFDERLDSSAPGCFAVELDKTFSRPREALGPSFLCRPCGYAAVLLHPKFQELMGVCETIGSDDAGVYIQGKKVVEARTSLLEISGAAHTSPVLLADDFRAWKLLWKDIDGAHISRKAEASTARLALLEWNQQLQARFPKVPLTDRISAAGTGYVHGSFSDEETILVAYQDSLTRAAVFFECLSNGTVVPGSLLRVPRSFDGSLLPASSGELMMRSHPGQVIWFALWDEEMLGHEAQDTFVPITSSTRELRIVQLTGFQELQKVCQGRFDPATPACNESCHSVQVYEANKTAGAEDNSLCPYSDGANVAERCFEGNCEAIPLSVVAGTTGALALQAANDELVTTSSRMSSSAIEIVLHKPAEIWSLRGFFTAGKEAPAHFQVSLMDQNRGVIYRLPTSLPKLSHRNRTYWEWQDMHFYRVQFIRIEATEPASQGAFPEVVEFQALGRGLPLCSTDGFFTTPEQGCAPDVEFLLKTPDVWDCRGEWSEWSYCDSTCRSTRFLKKTQDALYGGKPCPVFEKKACSDGPRCNYFNKRVPDFRQRRQDCVVASSSWSECRNCRRLKVNHRVREAAGDTEVPCPPFFEVENCPPPCDSELTDWKVKAGWKSWWSRFCQYMAEKWAQVALGVTAPLLLVLCLVAWLGCMRRKAAKRLSRTSFTERAADDDKDPLVPTD